MRVCDTVESGAVGPGGGPAHGADRDADEAALVLRVLDALLREDVAGLRTRGTVVERPDGRWLRLADDAARGGTTPVGAVRGRTAPERAVPGRGVPGQAVREQAVRDGADAPPPLLLPVTDDGFQCALRARLPLLLREPDGVRFTTCGAVLAALAAYADPADRGGFDAFAAECGQTLDTTRLHTATWRETADRLTARHGPDPARWTGLVGSLAYDALAARHDHPVYPTARGRAGLSSRRLTAYAPEFAPRFALRWLSLPCTALTVRGGVDDLPGWWPGDAGTGRLAFPVHPLTPDGPLRDALRAAGLDADTALRTARPAREAAESGDPYGPPPYPLGTPTLSMRTVALADDPRTHLKLPLPTATLGLRNRRTVKPGTLTDGAACQRLLEEVVRREPRFRESVLLADETCYAHAGHELLAFLRRRYPAGLDDALVVPLAALLAPAPDGRLVVDHLADRHYGGDPVALLDAVLVPLLDWQTTLFGYGVALESHQQNVSLVLDRPDGTPWPDGTRPPTEPPPRVRLLFKDNDGPRVHTARLRGALGPGADALAAAFDDARITVDGDGPVADLFTTVTVHLCAGAYAYGLARHGRAPLGTLLALVRDRLGEAAERLGTAPGEPGAVLRARVLDADRLPVKAMVTAGTLLSKERSGAADVNKHYVSGPNYLRTGA